MKTIRHEPFVLYLKRKIDKLNFMKIKNFSSVKYSVEYKNVNYSLRNICQLFM